MQEKIKKINLKIFSVIGIILSVSALIFSVILPNSGNEKLNNFDSWAVIIVFMAVVYLLVFSILNLFKLRKILSILGTILSLLAVILGSIVCN
jgi:heme/copper-type cytochrome/quinol oxidase subunit 2